MGRMPLFTRSVRLALACVCAVAATLRGGAARAAAPILSAALPPALSAVHAFRGRIDYVARRDDGAADVTGTLIVRNGDWTLDERSTGYELRAGSDEAEVLTGSSTLSIGDLLSADPLANPWAAMLGDIATQTLAPVDLPNAWASSDEHVFVDPAGTRIIGFGRNGSSAVAFTFDDWTQVGSLAVPRRALRLRNGIPDAGYSINEYRIVPATVMPSSGSVPFPAAAILPRHLVTPLATVASTVYVTERNSAMLFATLFLCLAIVAWTRRDALIVRWCRWMARDPRGWRRAGVSVFVDADGTLICDGKRYRVGPHFYGRAVLVQQSALFVRVSAPAVPHATILARKFRPIDLGIRPLARARRAVGFTLVETMLATGMFGTVVLLAVYPAIVAVARADALAAERADAVVLASNALADEEAASAYDNGVQLGTTTREVDGLTVAVSVSAGTMHHESDVDIVVSDRNGDVVAHVATWLGAPVKAPPASGGGPPSS